MNFKQKKTKESIKIIENCSSNENEIKKKKRKRTLHADTPLGICSDINNTHFEINSTKKNKKRKLNIDNLGMIPDKSTEEIAIKKETVGFIKKVENCSFKANEIKKKKGKRTAFPDSLFENNSVKNNTRFEVMIPTKKSKFKTNIDNVEININNSTEEMTINQDTEESIINNENYSSNENKKKHKIPVPTGASLENNSDINYRSLEVTPTKKKKRSKINLDTSDNRIEDTTRFQQETEELIQNVENCSFKANKIKKKKGKRTAFPDSFFENNSVKSNTRFEVMIPKKKSKYKTNADNVEININNSTEEMTNNQETEESIINIENHSSKENKKKHMTLVPTGALLENNSDINYRSLEVTPTKKKKRRKINLDSSDIKIDKRIEETTRFQQETEELIQNVENCTFKANEIKKKKGKKTAFPDSLFENNSVKSNARFEVMTPKKKSKYKTNADNVEININDSTEEMTNNQDTEESIINNENKKKHKTPVPTGALLENNSDINYRSLEVTPTKKKKRRKINLDSTDIKIDKRIEETTRLQQETEELIQNVENCTFKANEITKNEGKITDCPDIPFENNSVKSNARFEVMTPKKKSKYKTNADNVEININNSTEEMTINQDTEESIINNENKKKHKTPVPTGAIMENNSDINYRSLEVTPTKKKKRRKINLDSSDIKIDKRIEETTRLQQETEELIQNVENCTFKANEITKNEGKITDCPDIPFENNSVKSNARFEVMTPKKKSKYKTNADNVEININDSTEEMTNNQDTEESIINIENHSSKENKKKHMTPVPTGASLKNNCDINYRSLEESSTKKNKINLDNLEINIDKSIDEITKFQQETEEFVKNVENCSLKANEITKNNGKRTESPDSLFENNSEKNNTRFEVMTPKKNSKYKTNIDNSEVNINISTEEMFINQDTEDSIVNIENHSSNENEIKNNKHKRTVLTSESLKNNSEKSNTSFKKKCISNNTNSNNLSNRKIRKLNNNITTSDSPICQLDSDLSDILNCIEMLESNEEVNSSDTTEMKFNYNYYHLIDFLTSSDPSLEARSDSAFILSDLSNQIRKCINQHYKVVKKWEIELLRFIGQKILTKILAKYNSAENIMDLCIQVANTNPLHYVETKLSRQPKKEELDKIRKQFPLLKLGVFNKDEDNIIREYWSKFQQEYNISDVKPFLLNGLKMASLSSHEKFNFFRYISAGLPNRLLYSVYNRFNVLFDEKVDRLSFSEEEDKIIQRVVDFDAIKNNFSVLSLLLNRTRLQLYRRVNTLKMQPLRQYRIYWNITQHQELFTNILIETETENWKDLKNMTIKKNTWIAITERCSKNINNYEKNRTQWKFLSTMLFCEKPIVYSTLKSTIFQYLLKLNPENWSDIDWVKITNTFYPGACSKVIVTLYYRLVFEKLPWEERTNVRDCLKYLSNNADDYINNENNNKVFPRLTVEDHNVLVKIE